MSSKRGRKRNDNLPPNRARDVQRAFRARRANYIATLEETGAPKPSPSRGSRQLIPPRPASALPQSPT